MTAEEIYTKIASKSVSKEMGIKLIENYGIRQQRYAVKTLSDDTPMQHIFEIENVIERMSAKLDELLEKVLEAYKK